MPFTVRGNTVQTWRVPDGSDTNPGVSFRSARGSGLSHAGDGTVRVSVNSNKVLDVAASGVTVYPSGSASAPTLRFANAMQSGLFNSSATQLSIAANGRHVASFSDTGMISAVDGTVAAPAIGFPNSSGIFHSGNGAVCIASNGSSLAEIASTRARFQSDTQISVNYNGSQRILATAAGVTLFGNILATPATIMSISNIQIASGGTVVDDTALVSNVGGTIIINGSGFQPGSIVRVGTTNADSTSFINSTQLSVALPAKPAGTYDVTIAPYDGYVLVLPNGITYSPLPTWSTSDTSLGTSINSMYFSYPIATSDSNIKNVTIATAPPGTEVSKSGNVASFEGTIGNTVTTDTLYSMTIGIQDQENQDASKTFTLQHVATYSSSLLKNGILKALQTSRDSAIVDAASDTLTTQNGPYPGNSAYRGGVLLASGNVFCVPHNSTTAQIYDPVTNGLTTIGGFPGSSAYSGGVLLPNGNVFCVPYNATTARVYNPKNNTLTTPTGTAPGFLSYRGGVLMPNGNVFCVPNQTATARIYNPATNALTTPATITFPGGGAYDGGVLLTNGNVFLVPGGPVTTARVYNPSNNTLTTPTGTTDGAASAYRGGVLLPDGKVFCVPNQTSTARIYDPVTNALTTPATAAFPGTSSSASFAGGVLLPDGRVFLVPNSLSYGLIYDPRTNMLTTPNGSFGTGSRYYGGVLLPDGKVFCVPADNTTARIFTPGGTVSRPLSNTVILSSFLNKF